MTALNMVIDSLKTLRGTKTEKGIINVISMKFGHREIERKIRELIVFRDEDNGEYKQDISDFIEIFEAALVAKLSKADDFKLSVKGMRNFKQRIVPAERQSYLYTITDMIANCSICLEDKCQISICDRGSCAQCYEFACCEECFDLLKCGSIYKCPVCQYIHTIAGSSTY